MSVTRVRLRPDTYVDSVRLMTAVRAMEELDGVEQAFALMATPANLAVLRTRGFDDPSFSSAAGNDLILAAQAADETQADAALTVGGEALETVTPSGREEARQIGTVEDGAAAVPGANVAIVSVPGDFAALQTHKALTEGLHTLLFSDNVSVEDEAALKERGAELGLFVMGPGAGTAMFGGSGSASRTRYGGGRSGSLRRRAPAPRRS